MSVKKIAVFRALYLGDLLCAVPAFRALRHAFPDAHISLIGLPGAAAFVERYGHYLDELIPFPGCPGLPEVLCCQEKTDAFVRDMRVRKFDLLLQMHGNGTIVNQFLHRLGAVKLAGFRTYYQEDPGGEFLVYPEHLHEVRRHLALMETLGIPSAGEHLEFPVHLRDILNAEAAGLYPPRIPFICVHPGSKGKHRQWAPAHFAGMANEAGEKGFGIVLTGTADEKDITAEVRAHIHFPVIDAAGRTSLGELAVLLKRSKALITNCTGVSHLAAALKVRSVVISMDGEPHRWAPLDTSLHYTIDWTRKQDYGMARRAMARLLALP